jgi:Flp pilus assembly protein TadD
MQINRANVTAVRLLSEGRAAGESCCSALALDPKNGFTLNNLGVAKEAQGEYNEAIRYYAAVADSHADETVVVTMDPSWRGKSVSDMAAASARRLNIRMRTLQTPEAQTALLNLRGVSAMNRNDWQVAWENFSQAFKLSPNNPFSLNNQGYGGTSGDLETAQEFYREAQSRRIRHSRRTDHPPRCGRARLYSISNESEAGSVDRN